jgi:hypothetical protein
MESQRLGERQCFPHVTGEPLTDRVMPALDMSPLARWLVHGAVGRLGEDGSIGRPEVAVTPTTSIGFRDGLYSSWTVVPSSEVCTSCPVPLRSRYSSAATTL